MTALMGATAAPPPDDRSTVERPPRTRRRGLPFLLLLPGGLWLLLFFVVPSVQLAATSLYDRSGSLETGYRQAFAFGNYVDAVAEYWPHLLRSAGYAGIATVICLLLGYPLAYAIAQKAGRWRTLLLVCVIAPFFTTFLLRTLAWKSILSDNGPVVALWRALPFVPDDARLLATPVAVVAGLVYNFLPFMVLPLYASLERLDRRMLEASRDLYARPVATFRRVTLPLSMPGVVAGTLLTFIPATGDYINAELLGTPNQYMIGNVIDSAFLVRLDYPQAAALSFLLMATILVMVFSYLRAAGTEEVV
ncbi:ABC transporter permease [Saccharomonospora sp. NPDC046836]|uniref:ABC transporter permease n=1 Tax=Saccharomonospora sp. NPDC046836 TaxID=3156921 RepID=UPI0033F3BCF9